jgi:hypothetical protein
MEIGILCEQALTRSFHEKTNNCVIDYRSKFEILWSDNFKVDNDITRLFIVWDGMPADERAGRLAPYLTALDWVLAFSLKLIGAGKAKDANFNIHLIDFTSDQFENSFTSENAPTLLEAIPWVALYAPLKRGRNAYTELPAPADITTGTGWAEKKTLAAAAKDPGLRLRLERLADMWQAWLVRSDDHHDVNNTAGPLRLCQKKTDIKDPSLLQTAFATRLDWVYGNLSPDQTTILKNRLKGDVQRTQSKLRGQNINLVLIDDMCEYGWDELFKQWSGIGKDYLTTISEPEDILKVIEKWETVNFQERNFKFHLFPHDKSNHQVIFLDMRLHGNPANRAANERNEKEFFKKLVTLIETWGLTKKNSKFAWPPISQIDLDSAKAWANDESTVGPLTIHSLLPRVMALHAPHIPIIILSSTRKRSVIEPLKPYGNIFTALEKPNVIGSDDNTLERFHSNWQEAWKHAGMLLQTTHHVSTIDTFSNTIQGYIKEKANINNPYIEIYMEERKPENGPFMVGGVIAIYNNNPQKPWEKFDDVLYENEICYYDPLVPPRSNTHITIHKKEWHCNHKLQSALQAADTYGFKPEIFSYSLSNANPSQPLRNLGDLLFYQPAAKALEILLFETLPTYLGEKAFSVSIYVATRSRYEQVPSERFSLMHRFGYSPSPWKPNLFESVSGHSILPMLSQLFEKRNPDRITIDRCLAVTLKYENAGRAPDFPTRFYCRECGAYLSFTVKELKDFMIKNTIESTRVTKTGERDISALCNSISKTCIKSNTHEWIPDYRALHYLADEILRSGDKYSAVAKELPGFNAYNDPDLYMLLDASQLADKGDRVLSLIMALETLHRLKVITATDVKGIILARLARCLPNLSGDEYLKVAKATQSA